LIEDDYFDKIFFNLVPRGIFIISAGAYLMTPLLPTEIGVIMAALMLILCWPNPKPPRPITLLRAILIPIYVLSVFLYNYGYIDGYTSVWNFAIAVSLYLILRGARAKKGEKDV